MRRAGKGFDALNLVLFLKSIKFRSAGTVLAAADTCVHWIAYLKASQIQLYR